MEYQSSSSLKTQIQIYIKSLVMEKSNFKFPVLYKILGNGGIKFQYPNLYRINGNGDIKFQYTDLYEIAGKG